MAQAAASATAAAPLADSSHGSQGKRKATEDPETPEDEWREWPKGLLPIPKSGQWSPVGVEEILVEEMVQVSDERFLVRGSESEVRGSKFEVREEPGTASPEVDVPRRA